MTARPKYRRNMISSSVRKKEGDDHDNDSKNGGEGSFTSKLGREGSFTSKLVSEHSRTLKWAIQQYKPMQARSFEYTTINFFVHVQT